MTPHPNKTSNNPRAAIFFLFSRYAVLAPQQKFLTRN
jgi:hypothetical protein